MTVAILSAFVLSSAYKLLSSVSSSSKNNDKICSVYNKQGYTLYIYQPRCKESANANQLAVYIMCVHACYTNNLKTRGHILSNDCSNIRDIICMVKSCMRDPIGELWPQTRISRILIQHCVRILQARAYIHCYLVCNDPCQYNKTHIAYDCTLYTKQRLYCQ